MRGVVQLGCMCRLDIRRGRVNMSDGGSGRAMAQVIEQLFQFTSDNETFARATWV